MGRDFDDMIEHLKWLTFWIRHCRDQAEAKMREVNHLIWQLGKSGLLHEAVLLGEVVHTRYYTPQPGGHDSGRVAQAAQRVPGGIGAVLWDGEEYARLRDAPGGLGVAAGPGFRPFEQCEPALKALLLPQIEPLLQQLRSLLP